MVTAKQLEELKAPLKNAEVEWRAQRCGTSAKDQKYAAVVPYLNRLEVIDRRLDPLGADNWRNEVQISETGVLQTISILVDRGDGSREWVSRTDGAAFTNIEGFKGGISDAFKRACVLWGIGHELYKVREVMIFDRMIHDGYPPDDGGDYIKLQAKDKGNGRGWSGWCKQPTIEGWQKLQDEKKAKKEETPTAGASSAGNPGGGQTSPPPEDNRYQGDESPRFTDEVPMESYSGELDIY